MTRVTALLIVLALTGSPVAALACAGLCRPATDDSAAPSCHDHGTGTDDPALSPDHRCETPSDTLYVVPREARATDQLTQPASTLLTIADPWPAAMAAHHDRWRGPAPPVTSQLRSVVLRI